MKKWLVTIAALWLAGCRSGEINKNACYGVSRSLFLTIWRGMVWFIKPVM